MTRIRHVQIENFRGIKSLSWFPAQGLNCLIGPGDSGKSSVLDAIDLCLGARRNIQFTDADFHRLDVQDPIRVSVTLGELDDRLQNLDAYGMYLRSFDAETRDFDDEPESEAETVITIRMTVGSDLEPSWSLISERAEAQGLTRNLTWGDRVRLAPTRIGTVAQYHLGWRPGSVLNRVSEERADASAELASVARTVRAAFGDGAEAQLGETLGIVTGTARELGVPVGESVKAMLDAHSVSLSGGTISLHDEDGVPLRGLGTGSTRLLIGGLQRKAAEQSTIILIDELEHGLEPHRIMRLLGSLGAKEDEPPLQVFMTTHSPVVLQELSGAQLFVIRPAAEHHEVMEVGVEDDMQSTIRKFPEAFLAASVIVCEGASEVGLVRGLDQYRTGGGSQAIAAQGVALVDCGGGTPDIPFKRAAAFRALGYRTAVMRDDDLPPPADVEAAFIAGGGMVVACREGRKLEEELFLSLSDDGVTKLVDKAIGFHGQELIDEHIKSASENAKDLGAIRAEVPAGIGGDSRAVLGQAAGSRRNKWFKSVTYMEDVGREVVGPDLLNADEGFRALLEGIFAWAHDGTG